MYLFVVINLLYPQSCFSSLLPDALFCSQAWVVLYSVKVRCLILLWQSYLQDTTFTLVQGFIIFALLMRPSEHPLMKTAQNRPVIIRTSFQLSCVTQTIIAVCQYPAIFIVCSEVSLHISAFKSISGYGSRVFRVACFAWHQLSKCS
jgi:hypothetical protein